MQRSIGVCVLCVQDSLAQNDNPLSLPEGVIARLGKGELSWEDRAVAYSSDGTRLAVASHIGIWIYDANTGTEVALLTGQRYVYSVAFYSSDWYTTGARSGICEHRYRSRPTHGTEICLLRSIFASQYRY